jgi:hypothetical protein
MEYANSLRLQEVGDFEALNCQPSRNFDRSPKLDLTTEPPLWGRCCWRLVYLNILLSNGNLSILVIVIFEKSL